MSNSFSMPGTNSKYQIEEAEPASFLSGVWHGLLMPLFFIVSLFKEGVGIYETRNNGHFYNLGFLIGIGGFAGNTVTMTFGTTVL